MSDVKSPHEAFQETNCSLRKLVARFLSEPKAESKDFRVFCVWCIVRLRLNICRISRRPRSP